MEQPTLAVTAIQKEYKLPPLAKITRGYCGEGDKGYYVDFAPIYGLPKNLFFTKEEIVALVEAFEKHLDDTEDLWEGEE